MDTTLGFMRFYLTHLDLVSTSLDFACLSGALGGDRACRPFRRHRGSRGHPNKSENRLDWKVCRPKTGVDRQGRLSIRVNSSPRRVQVPGRSRLVVEDARHCTLLVRRRFRGGVMPAMGGMSITSVKLDRSGPRYLARVDASNLVLSMPD